MALLAIWIDGEKAKLYEFTEAKLIHTDLSDPSPLHHTHGEDQLAHQKKEQSFFKTLMPKLEKASSILILGPGVTKSHFQKFILENYRTRPEAFQFRKTCESLKI